MGVQAAFVVPHPAVIVPEIGRGQEKKIQKTVDACQEVARRIGEQKPETIVLISPHQVMYANYFHISPGSEAKGNFAKYGAEQIGMEISYDEEFVELLCQVAETKKLPAGIQGEIDPQLDHGTMVPLYFVNQVWKNYRLVRIGLSGLSLMKHYELGQCIKSVAEKLERNIVVIASGDLSHKLKIEGPYGFQKEGPEYDSRVMYVLGKGAFGELLEFPENLCNKAGECGHRALTMMAGTLDRTEIIARHLSYEGPFGIGYGVCEYLARKENPQRNFKEQHEKKERERVASQIRKQDAYVALARRAVEEYTRTGQVIPVPAGLPEELYQQLAEEIIYNAVSACSRDPRFQPVGPEELDRLTITVDVLGKLKKVNSVEELDEKKYGVIVSKENSQGLLLPDLDGVDSVQEQIGIAKRKAGIKDQEEVELQRFEVIRHF